MKVPNYTKGLVLDRPVANRVDLGQIDAAGALSRGVAEIADIGTQLTSQIKQANEMSAVNSAVIKRQREDIDFRSEKRGEWQGNPIGYAKAMEPLYKERDAAILQTLPSDEARRAYQETADRLNLKNYEDNLNWEHTKSAEMFVNNADQSINDLATMAYRGTPIEELKRQRAATTVTLGAVLSSEELVKFDADADKRIIASRIEGLLDTDPYQAKQELDSKEYDAILGVEYLNRLNDKAEAGINRLEGEKQKAEQKFTKTFKDDPASLAIAEGAQTPEQIISKQLELGVRKGNISVIPNQDAALIANQINGVTNSDQMIQELRKIQSQYPDEYYNIALKDLKNNGLSEDMTFIAMMNEGEDKQIMDATFAMAREEKNFTDLSKARGVMQRDITAAVEDRIEELRDVYLSEGGKVAGLNNKLDKIAIYFTAQGMDIESSATLATEWLIKKAPLAEVNGKQFRIPVDYNPDDIEDALEFQLDKITENDINTIGTGEFSLAALKREARFVLSPSEEYYYLKNQVGTPVLKKGTKEIMTFPIKDVIESLKLHREQIDKKVQKQLIEENIKGFDDL